MTDIVPTPATDNQTAAKMPKSTSPLLNLPPELRNTIYRYALQRPSGVDPKKPGSPSVWHSSHQVSSFWSFNQLKYTCRQLRNETSALASLCNELWFESWSQINQFLSRYPAESYGDLQTLHVRHDHKIFVPKLRAGVKYPHGVFSIQEIDVILEVASKCLQHSDLMIHIHLAALSAEDDHFIEMILPQARIFGRNASVIDAMLAQNPLPRLPHPQFALPRFLRRIRRCSNETPMAIFPHTVTFFPWERDHDAIKVRALLDHRMSFLPGIWWRMPHFGLHDTTVAWWLHLVEDMVDGGF